MTSKCKVITKERGSFVSNAAVNILNIGISLLIGLWFTSYLIKHLGTQQYGLIPLANTMVSYMGVATAGIILAVSRFVTIALEQNDISKANRVFNTALIGLWGISFALFFPVAVISWCSDWVVRVPVGNEINVRWLFAFCGASFLITTATSAFGVSTFFRNRLDIPVWFTMASTLIRIVCVVSLFQTIKPQLWQVGASMLLAAIISALGFIWSWRQLTPELRICFLDWDMSEFRRLFSTAGWVCVNQVGTILLISIDLVVVNRLFGPLANTQYAVALQWSMMLRGIAGSMGTLFAPNITALYARRDVDGVVKYSLMSIKFMGIFLALPIGLISGLSSQLLRTWLGQEFVTVAPLMTLLTLPMALNLAYLPLHQINLATNDVRLPGLVQIAAGLVNLALAVVLAKYTSLGMYGVAIAGGFVLSLRNILFTPIYAAYILRVPRGTFYRAMVPCLAGCLACFGFAWLGGVIIEPCGWFQLGATAFLASMFYSTTSYFFLLSQSERLEVNEKACGYLKRLGGRQNN